MKKRYEEAEIEIIYIKNADIITASDGAGNANDNNDGNDLG